MQPVTHIKGGTPGQIQLAKMLPPMLFTSTLSPHQGHSSGVGGGGGGGGSAIHMKQGMHMDMGSWGYHGSANPNPWLMILHPTPGSPGFHDRAERPSLFIPSVHLESHKWAHASSHCCILCAIPDCCLTSMSVVGGGFLFCPRHCNSGQQTDLNVNTL